MSFDKKNIIWKLIREELSKEEELTILLSRPVTDTMREQWLTTPDMAREDRVDRRKIWKMICQETWMRLPARKVRLYKIYTWVASIALLFGLSGSIIYVQNRENAIPIYVVSTGIQNMEPVTLPDGTLVLLGPGTKLIYPASFTEEKREVSLDGQAFFDVSKNASKPFIVKTHSMDVEALGTAFELFAYSIENRSEAVLLSGGIKVNLINPDLGKQPGLILVPNEKLEYNIRDKKVSQSTVNADIHTSWRKRGVLTFENDKLSMIIPRLEQWYGRKVICEKGMADTYKFTFKVRDESLERILYIMGESSPIKYTKSEEGDYTLFLKR
jgi:ferric-dicitrate binding protein FerR (iron transport regulator)